MIIDELLDPLYHRTFGARLNAHGQAISDSREACRAALKEWIDRVQASLQGRGLTHDQEHEIIRERFRRLLEELP